MGCGNLPVAMRASNTGDALDTAARRLGGGVLAAMARGQLGFSVRCTPRRWTVIASLPELGTVFGKIRRGRMRDAKAEWSWLRDLPRLGLAVPEPVGFWRQGSTSVVATLAVRGQGLDALLRAALARGDAAAAVRFACRVVAPVVARLHEQGLVFRDLYWNHLFAVGLDADQVTFLDVERVFRPWFRRRRWIVKDLAGLLSSAPEQVSRTMALRFLLAYLGPRDRALAAALARDVARKAARIRAHVPRYG